MTLPHWVEQNIDALPQNFCGKIIIHCWTGGVANVETNSIQQAPKPARSERHALTA
jgi:hypothetical protein